MCGWQSVGRRRDAGSADDDDAPCVADTTDFMVLSSNSMFHRDVGSRSGRMIFLSIILGRNVVVGVLSNTQSVLGSKSALCTSSDCRNQKSDIVSVCIHERENHSPICSCQLL